MTSADHEILIQQVLAEPVGETVAGRVRESYAQLACHFFPEAYIPDKQRYGLTPSGRQYVKRTEEKP